MTEKNRSRIALAVGALPIAILLGACANSPTVVSSAPTTTVTQSAGAAAPANSPSAGARPQAQASAGNGLCKASDVNLSLGNGDSGAGTTHRPLVIKNVSGHECTIQGFPGVSYVGGGDGHQIGKDAFRDGTKGSEIKLAGGQSASADIGFTQAANFDPAACKPEETKGLRVYLPQETASMFVPLQATGCAGTTIPGNQLTVKTVHSGTAG